MTKCACRILKMFQNVEHQNQRVELTWPEPFVEGACIDAVTIGIVRSHQFGKRFDPFYVSELSEAMKEQTVTATYIQNGCPSSSRLKPPKHFNDKLSASAPPPMAVKKIAVTLSIFRIHRINRSHHDGVMGVHYIGSYLFYARREAMSSLG